MVTRLILLLYMAIAGLALSGCSTYQGADMDQYDRNDRTYLTESGSAASPTFRPGMYPRDIRDPSSVMRPLPPPMPTP